jgi:hypothetical protein
MSEEGFFSRWSRRKRAGEAGQAIEEPAPGPAAETPPVVVEAEEEPFDITTLPPIESLTLESDIAAFLRKGVPAVLQRAALRRAWSLDPAIRDFVGPADYAWDYNAVDGVPGASLTLTGNIKEMLAQAFGPAPDEDAASQPSVEVAAPTDDAPPAQAADTPPEPPVTLVEAPESEPVAATVSTGRRHGSALPS